MIVLTVANFPKVNSGRVSRGNVDHNPYLIEVSLSEPHLVETMIFLLVYIYIPRRKINFF